MIQRLWCIGFDLPDTDIDTDMEVCFICVNYNSYHHLLSYAKSIAVARLNANIVECQFVVVDNSSRHDGSEVIRIVRDIFPDCLYIKSENIGYYPGVAVAVNALGEKIVAYDYIAVSNVDLEVSPDFLVRLSQHKVIDRDGVIAPSIFSRDRCANLNPKILVRPTRKKLKRTVAIFKSLFFYLIYVKMSKYKVLHSKGQNSISGAIYAPHGSFVLFTKQYFLSGGKIDYPCFLFGEEIFVAEECASLGLNVHYVPELHVYDKDHGSTSLQKSSFISSEHTKSLQYLLEKYFD